MKCLVTDAKRHDCFWFHLRLLSLPVDTHWKYKRELEIETRIVWRRMKTRVRVLRYSSEWCESEWLWNQRAWKASDGSTDGENGNSGAQTTPAALKCWSSRWREGTKNTWREADEGASDQMANQCRSVNCRMFPSATRWCSCSGVMQ